MNETKTRSPRPEKRRPVQRRLTPEERERIIKERRRKKKIQKLKKAVAFVLCACVIAVCANIAVKEFLKEDTVPTVETSESKTQNNTNMDIEGMDLFADDEAEGDVTEFSVFDYYKEENAERYENYSQEFPQLSAGDVVWRVNANQDMPKYGYDIPAIESDDILIIVNKYYKVPDDYKPDDMVVVDDQYLREEAAVAFKEMQSDAGELGFKIQGVSGYRSVSRQETIYEGYLNNDAQENVDRYSARPGYSEHHTGLAIDVYGSVAGLREFENTPEYPWVRDNCYKYGYIIRYLKETEDITGYEAEPWHLRYVGVEVSTEMKEKNIKSLEEYYAKYIG